MSAGNAVQSFIGMAATDAHALADYLVATGRLDAGERDSFVEEVASQISLIADSDAGGAGGVIDEGIETLALAQYFSQRYPNVFGTSRTATEISSYFPERPGEKRSSGGTGLYSGQLADPEDGVTFANAESFSPGGDEGVVFENGPITVSRHAITFTDADGNPVSPPNYVKCRTYDGIRTEQDNFAYFASNDGLRATKMETQSTGVVFNASAVLNPMGNRVYLPRPAGHKVVSAKYDHGRTLDVFVTASGDYFVESRETGKFTWATAPAADHASDHKFQDSMQVPWGELDPMLAGFIAAIRTAAPSQKREEVQELLNYLETRTAYSIRAVRTNSSLREMGMDLLAQSNCAGSNVAGADMLAQAGVPVRLAAGAMALGRQHLWVEVYVDGEWVIVDFTPPVRNRSTGSDVSGWVTQPDARAAPVLKGTSTFEPDFGPFLFQPPLQLDPLGPAGAAFVGGGEIVLMQTIPQQGFPSGGRVVTTDASPAEIAALHSSIASAFAKPLPDHVWNWQYSMGGSSYCLGNTRPAAPWGGGYTYDATEVFDMLLKGYVARPNGFPHEVTWEDGIPEQIREIKKQYQVLKQLMDRLVQVSGQPLRIRRLPLGSIQANPYYAELVTLHEKFHDAMRSFLVAVEAPHPFDKLERRESLQSALIQVGKALKSFTEKVRPRFVAISAPLPVTSHEPSPRAAEAARPVAAAEVVAEAPAVEADVPVTAPKTAPVSTGARVLRVAGTGLNVVGTGLAAAGTVVSAVETVDNAGRYVNGQVGADDVAASATNTVAGASVTVVGVCAVATVFTEGAALAVCAPLLGGTGLAITGVAMGAGTGSHFYKQDNAKDRVMEKFLPALEKARAGNFSALQELLTHESYRGYLADASDDDVAVYFLQRGIIEKHSEWLTDKEFWRNRNCDRLLFVLFNSLKPQRDPAKWRFGFTNLMAGLNYVGTDERVLMLWIAHITSDAVFMQQALDGISEEEKDNWNIFAAQHNLPSFDRL